MNSYPYGGHGGSAFTQVSLQKVVMGGGGGAGTANQTVSGDEYQSSGGCGGGIVFMRAKQYAGTGSINADGNDVNNVNHIYPGGNNYSHNDAAGGGGAGGTIIAVTTQGGVTGLSGIAASANGGKGGNAERYYDFGPGGGGGGGVIYTNGTFASATVLGGTNGFTRTNNGTQPDNGTLNNAYGASSGSIGKLMTLSYTPQLENPNAASSMCGVLPLGLLQFSAVWKQQQVLVSWVVAAGTGFQQFEVEYSIDGRLFKTLSILTAQISIQQYQYLHKEPAGSANFYRLKLKHNNGSISYSETILLKVANEKDFFTYYIPASNLLSVQLKSRENTVVDIQIQDNNSRLLKMYTKPCTVGQNQWYLNVPAGLSTGWYFIRMNVSGKLFTAKVFIH